MGIGSAVAIMDYVHLGSSMSISNYGRMGTRLSVQDLIHTKDLVSDGSLMYHYASGGFIGASQVSAGDFYTSMAQVHGSLIANGGAVLGSSLGTEVKMDGASGIYRIRFNRNLGISF